MALPRRPLRKIPSTLIIDRTGLNAPGQNIPFVHYKRILRPFRWIHSDGGGGGGESDYMEFDINNQTEFIAVHNLEKYPETTFRNLENNQEVLAEVAYLNRNSLKVKFNPAFTGKLIII